MLNGVGEQMTDVAHPKADQATSLTDQFATFVLDEVGGLSDALTDEQSDLRLWESSGAFSTVQTGWIPKLRVAVVGVGAVLAGTGNWTPWMPTICAPALATRTSASEITHAVVRRFEAESLRSDAGFGARSIDDTLPESEDI